MRVLTVVPLPPGLRGGIEDYASSVLCALRGRAEVDVLAPADGNATAAADPAWGDARLHLVSGRWMFRRLIALGRRARSLVERHVRQADVVHLHMPCPRLEIWAAIAAMENNIPVLATYHMDAIYDGGQIDARPRAGGNALGVVYDSFSARPTLSRARVIVTNSLSYAAQSRLLPSFRNKVRAIHQGVNLDHTRSGDGGARLRHELLRDHRFLVTFLGRLVPYKGLHVLIEAADLLRDERITFAIAGKGPLKERLSLEVERRGLGDRVRFLGFVPDEQVGDLLHASDVVACPSISLAESTPIVLLEALACGTPIVGTRLGGSDETLPDDGVRGRLVPPRDSASLAMALRELLDANSWDPNRPPLFSRTWQDVATDYLHLYEEIVSG